MHWKEVRDFGVHGGLGLMSFGTGGSAKRLYLPTEKASVKVAFRCIARDEYLRFQDRAGQFTVHFR
ncbi:MAG: hypothetical protein HRT36_03960 [Alphaproteobacteria bacterium]|nr:hypothetical protein [Alphaproteobacteria bacterium]